MAGTASRENGKKGGRPPGRLDNATIDKLLKRERVRELVCAKLDPLVTRQIEHAMGIDHFFMRNEKTKQFERVTDPVMIEAALNAGDRESYYWIFTKDPSVQAFTDLMNRALDKPAEQLKVTGEDGGPVQHVLSWKK